MTLFIVVVAAVAATLFAVVVVQNASSREKKLDYNIEPFTVDQPVFERCMSHLLGPPLVQGNRITCLLNGDQIFPAMLDALRSAKHTINFETFIYWSGAIGKEFGDVLAERARAGVRVHVLLDWIGSKKLNAEVLTAMEDAGVEVEMYRPLRWYNVTRLNSRTHRKILVVDGCVGFIGGVGIADQWSGHAESPEHWRDSHFKVEGPAVAHLQAAFLDNWTKTRAEVLNDEQHFPPLAPVGDVYAQVFKSSPREGSGSARLMFVLSIAAARERILIANSYFVPDDYCRDALIKAQQRGVRVEIIVPGRHVDTAVTRRASRSRWGPLLEAGVAIYEYQPTMYHCKVMIVDGSWVTVGSMNFDNRSFRLNDEANLNALDHHFAEQQAEIFERDKQCSRQISFEEWRRRPFHERILEVFAGVFRSQL